MRKAIRMRAAIRGLLVWSILAAAPAARSEGEEGREAWTLAMCLEQARAASHRLAAAAHEVDRTDAAAREARAARLPTLDLVGTYAYASETMALRIGEFVPIDVPEVRFGDGNTYDLKLQASAPLYTGGALSSRARAEEAAARAAREDAASADLRLAQEVRRAFYTALGAEAQAEAARVAEGRMRRHLEEVEGAVRAGAASEERLVEALARLRSAEQVRIRQEGLARVEKLALGRLTGAPAREIEPAAELGVSLFDGGAPPDTAAPGRPELGALSERAARSEHLARAAKGAYYPSLAAQAAYHRAKPGVDAIDNEWMDYGTVGVTLSWSLWEWGARADRVRQARAAARGIEEQRAELEEAYRSAARTARVRLSAAAEQEAKAAERIDLGNRRRLLVEGRYRQGAATESEYLDAEDDLAAAEIDRAQARAAVRLAEADLLYALGR